MRYRGLTAIAHDAACGGVNHCGELRGLQRPCASDSDPLVRRRLAQKTEGNSAARDQTIVDYHGSRPGKVATRDFQPINLPPAHTTTSPPSSVMTQQAGKCLRREVICADGPSPVQENPGFSRLRRASPNAPRPPRVEKHIVAWSAMYPPSRTARKTPQVAIVTRQLQLVKGQLLPILAICFA
jgi:hypothetical protein